MKSANRTTHRGFTLLELIISMTVIFVLITTVVVALRGVRKSAARTQPLGALRQIMVAYNSYAAEHNGRFMPGYINPTQLPAPGQPVAPGQIEIRAKLLHPVGTSNSNILQPADAASYVWRLMPYFDYQWQTLMADYRSATMSERLQGEYDRGAYGAGSAGTQALGIARVPSFGLNSIYVGGDSFHGGTDVASRAPWSNTSSLPNLAATRMAEVKAPSKLLVFGSSGWFKPHEYFGGGSAIAASVQNLNLGYTELRPPLIKGPADAWVDQWRVSGDGVVVTPTDGMRGIPVDRLADEGSQYKAESVIPIGYLDGNVANEKMSELAPLSSNHEREGLQKIMSRWSPFTVSPY